MHPFASSFCALALIVLISPASHGKSPAPAPKASSSLAEYVSKADDSYRWQKLGEGSLGAGKYAQLVLTSQTWRDIPWKHQLFIYHPSRVAPGSQALLLIGGGSWKDEMETSPAGGVGDLPREAHILAGIAESLHAPVAVILQVPQQPIFDGMVEDEIISFTFSKYLETGDDEWPLLLPMVKSAVRGMDTVQEFARDEWDLDIEKFVVTGASKRGWTTWLTAAIDARVSALAPMVINMLNMEPHIELQRESFGGYSSEISDYTEKGLNEQLGTDRGIALRSIVDPYSYRDQIRQPKLIILGTNDAYWPVDSLNLYWDGLVGDKHIVYAPNEGHGMRDYPRVLGAVAALFESAAEGKSLPRLEWEFSEDDDHMRLKVTSDTPLAGLSLWSSKADSRDFREAKWGSRPVAPNGDGARSYFVEIERPETGFAAMYAEAKFNGRSMPYYLSTDLRVLTPQDSPENADGN